MFVLRAEYAEVGVLRFGGVELGFGLGDGFLIVDASFEKGFGQVERVLIGLDGFVEQLFLRVLRTEIEIVDGDFGLRGETDVLQIGGGSLRGVVVGVDLIAEFASEVDLIGGVKGKLVIGESGGGGWRGARAACASAGTASASRSSRAAAA